MLGSVLVNTALWLHVRTVMTMGLAITRAGRNLRDHLTVRRKGPEVLD
jgi:hypothetical protein